MSQFDFPAGEVLIVNKPLTWSSFQVVKKIKYAIGIRKLKVGHAGTLDPLATGVLVICTGKKTKEIEGFLGQDKEYEGTFRLGETTPSFDLETDVDVSKSIDHLTEELIQKAVEQLSGEILQVPPMFSAVKVDGERAYKHARQGQEIKLNPRQVHIHRFEILKLELPNVYFRIHCSKGTYIRSMARDFGEILETGAHLTRLIRTKSGNFAIEDAYELDDLVRLIKS